MPAPHSLRPEQAQALEYARTRGTEAPVASIRRRVAETFASLEALLGMVQAEEASRRPAPGKWSVQEVVDHLAVTDDLAVEEMRTLLAGQRPTGDPIPASLLSEDPFARSWEEVRAALTDVHRRFEAALAEAGEDLGPARAPVVLVLKVAEPDGSVVPVEWRTELDWKAYAVIFRAHTLEHVAQIERTLAAVRG